MKSPLTFTATAALLLAACLPSYAQKSAKPAHPTEYGQPDLQGTWYSGTNTPLERPADLAGKEFFSSDAEAATWLKQKLARSAANTAADPVGSYNDVFWEPGSTVKTRRTSMVTDPPDGKLPPLTAAARETWSRKQKAMASRPRGAEDRTLRERCLVFPTAPPPMIPYIYNSNYKIIQTENEVAIYVELNHDVRIIHLDGRPHLAPSVHLWLGDSVGHWEGNTLVVDTTNLTGTNEAWGADQNLHVIERFSRTTDDTLLYQWTVDDATAFTKTWKGEYTMTTEAGPLFEYACHEGNYALPNILKGARAQDRADQKNK